MALILTGGLYKLIVEAKEERISGAFEGYSEGHALLTDSEAEGGGSPRTLEISYTGHGLHADQKHGLHDTTLLGNVFLPS